jgi:hypothetical protein
MRWLVVCRLETAAIPADRIAQITGYHTRTIERTLENPSYQEWRDARLSNRVSAIDYLLADDAKEMKTALRELIPAAIHRLSLCLQSSDESIALRAATEILDRDERFSKTQQVAIMHLIPQAELDRARILARELRKQSTSTPQQIGNSVEQSGETKVLELPASTTVSDNKEDK